MQSEGRETCAKEKFEWLKAEEAAAYIKAKVRSFLLWVRQGKIKGYALSGTTRHVWRFLKKDLEAALLSNPVLMSETPTVLSKERKVA
ncbi:MAG: helix-turn-helix domain-containing protein [Candidatus Korobacteraceae bacterium]